MKIGIHSSSCVFCVAVVPTMSISSFRWHWFKYGLDNKVQHVINELSHCFTYRLDYTCFSRLLNFRLFYFPPFKWHTLIKTFPVKFQNLDIWSMLSNECHRILMNVQYIWICKSIRIPMGFMNLRFWFFNNFYINCIF